MVTTKELIQATLRRGECEVVFVKKDGSERQMVCTLHPDYLPQVDERAGGSARQPNDEVVVVWDVEASAWRSFRIDSIIAGPTLVEPV